MSALVTLDAVDFGYTGTDEFRLSIPTLSFEQGQHTAITGPSGCGKTTLLSLIAGILKADQGSVENQSVDLSNLADGERRAFRIKRIGLIFQSFELLEYLNVIDNVLLPYRVHPALRLDGPIRSRADALVHAVGLAGKEIRPVTALSQGEQQRVAVARALITEPPLLLADEPTGNLDPTNTLKVIDLLQSAAARSGATIITVTHDHSVLDRFDRVVKFADVGALE